MTGYWGVYGIAPSSARQKSGRIWPPIRASRFVAPRLHSYSYAPSSRLAGGAAWRPRYCPYFWRESLAVGRTRATATVPAKVGPVRRDRGVDARPGRRRHRDGRGRALTVLRQISHRPAIVASCAPRAPRQGMPRMRGQGGGLREHLGCSFGTDSTHDEVESHGGSWTVENAGLSLAYRAPNFGSALHLQRRSLPATSARQLSGADAPSRRVGGV